MEFTGERIIPEVQNYFFYEHVARYKFAKDRLREGQNILDVGCGDGYGTFYLSSFTKTALGIDVSKETVKAARERYQRPNLRYEAVDPKDWNLPADSFDAVVCFEVFEHVADPGSILAQIRRVLKPGGLLIISTPNKDVFGDNLPNPYHVREYTLEEFRAVIEQYIRPDEIVGQRNRRKLSKAINFSLVRLAMRHPVFMRGFNMFLSLKPKKRMTIERIDKIPAHGNYFTVGQDHRTQETADYFLVLGRK